MTAQLITQLVALHMGGIPELAMFLGPILLIVAFVRIARRNDALAVDEDDDWDADLGDLPAAGQEVSGSSPGSQRRS